MIIDPFYFVAAAVWVAFFVAATYLQRWRQRRADEREHVAKLTARVGNLEAAHLRTRAELVSHRSALPPPDRRKTWAHPQALPPPMPESWEDDTPSTEVIWADIS